MSNYIENFGEPYYRLSYPQLAIWAAEHNSYKKNRYNQQFFLTLDKNSDPEYIQKLCQSLVDTYDQTRTVFFTHQGDVYQRTLETYKVNLDHITTDDSKKRSDQIAKYIEQPYSFTEKPPVRFCMIHSSVPRLLICWSHLLSDGWSDIIVGQVLDKAYADNDVITGTSCKYSEFVEYEDHVLTGENSIELHDFWFRKITSISPLALGGSENNAGSKLLRSRRQISHKILTFMNYTPYTVLISSLSAFIARLTNREDIPISIPLLNRQDRRFFKLLGNCVNTGYVASKNCIHSSFVQLTNRVQTDILDNQNHQSFPIFKLFWDEEIKHVPTNLYCGMVRLPRDFSLDERSLTGSSEDSSTLYFPYPADLNVVLLSTRTKDFLEIAVDSNILSERNLDIFFSEFLQFIDLLIAYPEKSINSLEFNSKLLGSIHDVQKVKKDGNQRKNKIIRLTDTEAYILSIWKDVLGITDIGTDTQFFALGGNSLNVIQVINRLKSYYGIHLDFNTLFRFPTITTLAERIDTLQSSKLTPQTIQEIELPASGTADDSAYFELSFSQNRMFFLYNLDPDSTAYNIHVSVMLNGPVEPDRLRECYETLIDRHEMLRTVFSISNNTPVQKILPESHADFEIQDFRSLQYDSALKGAEEAAEKDAYRVFDIYRRPPHFIRVYLISDTVSLLLISMHHIICDQWSVGILGRELSLLYDSSTHGREANIPPLDASYRDYVSRQRSLINQERFSDEKKYWIQRLENVSPVAIPADVHQIKNKRFKGERLYRYLTDDEKMRLQAFCRENTVTEYLLILAALGILFHKYTGEEDLLIASPIANRNTLNDEYMIGTFVNTLLLRIQPRGSEPFMHFLEELSDNVVQDISYGFFPFEKIMEFLQPVRTDEHIPMVHVMFNMATVDFSNIVLDGLIWKEYPLSAANAQFDLNFIADVQRTQSLSLIFREDLYSKTRAQNLLDSLVHILLSCIEQPEVAIDKISLLNKKTERQIIRDWNQTKRNFDLDKGLSRYFSESAQKYSKKEALRFGDLSYTYHELDIWSSHLSNQISSRINNSTAVVGIFLDRSPVMIAALLGAVKAGVPYVPMDPSYPRERLLYMLDHSGAELLITQKDLDEDLGFYEEHIMYLTDQLPEDISVSESLRDVSNNELAYILYTSGSTGNPKGVMVTRRNILNFLLAMKEAPGFQTGDSIIALTPISFDISVLEIFLPIISGGTIVLADSATTGSGLMLNKLISVNKPTHIQATPATYRMLLGAGWETAIPKILCGGEAFPPEIVQPLKSLSEEIWNMYGPTETTVWSSISRVTDEENIDIGIPIANTEMYILDNSMHPLPPGVIGDLYIGGEGVSRGYFNEDELTKKVFIENPCTDNSCIYKTGDLAMYQSDGSIIHMGRSDFQIKLNGYRIEAGEVEKHLLSHPYVDQVVVMKREDAGIPFLVAYIVPGKIEYLKEANQESAAGELRDFLKNRIPAYMIPAQYLFLEAFPLTPNGKVHRKALPQALVVSSVVPSEEAPVTYTEWLLFSIWQEILKTEHIGRNTNFFDLGGHSLLAIQLTAEISKRIGISVSLKDFFRDPTIKGIAVVVDIILSNRGMRDEVFEDDVLFRMKKGEEQNPLIIVSGVFADDRGLYKFLSELVRHIPGNKSIYGLRPRSLIDTSFSYSDIQMMAADYLKTVSVKFPDANISLAGECVGGIVAWEMVQQSQQSNLSIHRLILMDTDFPKFIHIESDVTRYYKKIIQRVRKFAGMLLQTNEETYLGEEEVELNYIRSVERKFLKDAIQYIPEIHSVETILILNEEHAIRHKKVLGWKKFVSSTNWNNSKMYITSTAGNHVTRLTEFGEQLGILIQELIEN